MTGLAYGTGVGGRTLVAAAGLLVWSSADDAAIDRVWAARAERSGPLPIIEKLSPGGFAGLPEFALVLWSGTTATLLLRGIDADVRAGGVSEQLIGSGLGTWLEREFHDVESIRLGVGEASRPLVEGVVDASSLVLELAESTAAAPGVRPVPAREPAPVMEAPPVDEEATIAGFSEDAVPVDAVPVDPQPVDDPAVIPPAPAIPAADETDDEFGDLFGATIVRDIEAAAVRPAADPLPSIAPLSADDDPDHDGETITVDQLAALRTPTLAPTAPPPVRVIVPQLRSASGEVIPIDGPVIIGRSPRVTEPTGAEHLPRLVSVAGNQDMSRNHARFDADGGTVVVTDLESRNGTQYTLPGRTPTRLRSGEQATLIPGATVDLGGGAVYTVEAGA